MIADLRDNRLLSRKELDVVAYHPGMPIPSKEEIREKISELYQTKKDNVVVMDLKNRYGTHRTTLKAKIYSSIEVLSNIEKKHIVAKLTGKEFHVTPRRVRKDERKKRYKIFGTLKRAMKKAERKNK
ncbi:ribosomal protein S24 [Encephalitozoon cuniculi]|uniref:40S ribosomal protein S24 n=1 Tax=Encephalitozoon cuniculi TaxID=6035 RepID=M1KLJ8_ENCCN|nr:40S ribosomal protein S24 [Encephalitozoon cuniculi]UYI26622.1 ribosomal protein S24 [Encephalitozoon cuniculi]